MGCISLFLRGYSVKYDGRKPLVERMNGWYVISFSVCYPPSQNTWKDCVVFAIFEVISYKAEVLYL